jgi:diguanylate cyclase (GGDEF)-like protein
VAEYAAIGAIPSMAPYLPVYLGYILPMLLPVVIVNYLKFSVEHSIFATMAFLFIVMLIITATHFRKLMMKTITLDKKLQELVDQLSISIEEIKKISRTDPLTELPNRRSFDETLSTEWRRSARDKNELSLLLIDIDNFKVINDGFGHPEGDEYLKAAAKIMLSTLSRASDFLARIGGDEFAIILSNTPLSNALIIAENLRQIINEYNKKSYPDKNISISIGLSSNATQGSLQPLITDADRCLYKAKSLGKNRVISFI